MLNLNDNYFRFPFIMTQWKRDLSHHSTHLLMITKQHHHGIIIIIILYVCWTSKVVASDKKCEMFFMSLLQNGRKNSSKTMLKYFSGCKKMWMGSSVVKKRFTCIKSEKQTKKCEFGTIFVWSLILSKFSGLRYFFFDFFGLCFKKRQIFSVIFWLE